MGGELEREIELAVRPPAFTLVRLGALCGDLPAEARTALRAIHSAEVGLYQVAPGPRSGRRAGLLTAVDQAMIKRGWERIVGVVDGPTVVAVFAPHNLRSNRDLSLAVMVCEGSQVVLASVRGDPEILAELAFEQARQHSRRALVSAR
jgi:hypothetical protein